MALQKQNLNINFSKGVDTKTDPFQVQAGSFLSVVNSIFTKAGLLQKRNGFDLVTTAPGSSAITTYGGNLIALGNLSLSTYSADANIITNSGFIQPLTLSAQSMVRSATSQTTVDMGVASNGLACSAWLDSDTNCYYQVCDSATGLILVPKTQLPSTAAMPRVFVLGNYFVVTFLATVSGVAHLQYVAVSVSAPQNATAATDIATNPSSISAAYDGIVANNNLYIAYNKTSTIGLTYITSTLIGSTPISLAGNTANLISMCADTSSSTPTIWLTWYNSGSSEILAAAYDYRLNATPILGATVVVSSVTANEITATATAGVLTTFYEVANTYSYSPNAKTDYIATNTMTIGGTAGTAKTILRGVGLGSKAIYTNSNNYMIATYGQQYQPTYFLIDGSGNVLAKFAYENGGGYAINQILPSINVSGTVANPTLQVGYLYKDLLAAVNSQGAPNTAGLTPSPAGVYSQTGINLATITLNTIIYSTEIAGSLQIGAGFEWQYDGAKPVEHNFHVWPEDITAVWSTTGGNIAAQPDGSTNTDAYYYQVCYEWTDAAGELQRSTPSVPVAVTTTMSGTTGSITVNVPYARLTYKTTNKIRIVIYRWSVKNQTYYRVTSITSPTINNPAADSVAFVDTLADATVIGNDQIYTTGGVLEDIPAPASIARALYDDRSWLIDSEDQNLLWFSKQIIEGTPVEYSDDLTMYVAPSTGAQGSTGTMTAIYPMDDKIIIFKKDAIYYINGIGQGPDNTGANNNYGGPYFITSTVGTTNPNSIVMIPTGATPGGLMFQSDKGIWLLGRDLSVSYLGAAVEKYNAQTVTSALCIPATNQVRFTLNNNICLMYDYFYNQWGTFLNVSGISSTIYQGLHTYLNKFGQICQETPGDYLDLTAPVLLSFATSWITLAGIQGYERFYDLYLLASYISPHFLQVQVGYDYQPVPEQQTIISPNNYTGVYGSDPTYGYTTPYGGPGTLEQWRIHAQRQTCESFQVIVQEIFNSGFGNVAGAGFTMSGINATVGLKKGRRPTPAVNTAG